MMVVWELVGLHWVFVRDLIDMDSYLGAAHVADPGLDQIAHHHRRDWDACGREYACNSKSIRIGQSVSQSASRSVLLLSEASY